MLREKLCNFTHGIILFIDVRHRLDTAALPFGSWRAWIVLVIRPSRCMAVIPLGGAGLILGRSLQTLAGFYFSGSNHHQKYASRRFG